MDTKVMTHRVPSVLYQRLKERAHRLGISVNLLYTGIMELVAEGKVTFVDPERGRSVRVSEVSLESEDWMRESLEHRFRDEEVKRMIGDAVKRANNSQWSERRQTAHCVRSPAPPG